MARLNTTALIIGSAIVVIVLAGAGTYAALRYFKPAGLKPLAGQSSTSATSSTPQTGDDARKQAEQYMQAGNLPQAKNAYQKAYDDYTSEKNTPAAADAKIQIEIIESKLSKQSNTHP